jgi:CIC family chloride channel protein
MHTIGHIKRNIQFIKLRKLIIVSVLISFLSAFLGLILKNLTEHYEQIFYNQATLHPIFIFIFPVFGLSVIYSLRQYVFNKKENKGINEIFASTNSKSKNLPSYKIPSHFINGLLTVVFGGSTGIEVSTVVATATIGSVAQRKQNVFKEYKTELICAGIAAGITALFNSPLAGIFFVLEVISRKITRTFIISNVIAVIVAFALVYLIDEKPIFATNVTEWHARAIPYFILLGIIAGVNSVYLTRCVLFFKNNLGKIESHYYKILIGSVLLSCSLFFFPQLYGEGYHAIKMIFTNPNDVKLSVGLLISFIGIIILKPIVTSATLFSGGDGGVFAPSLFIGAFLGLLLAVLLNTYTDANIIPLNFMIIGMAAVLSASIHAPFTALFLMCGLINDYTLFFPILVVCLIAKYTAKFIYPYSVYTYAASISK